MRPSLIMLAAQGFSTVFAYVVPNASIDVSSTVKRSAAGISLALQVSRREEGDPQGVWIAANNLVASAVGKHGHKTLEGQPKKRQSSTLSAGAINKGEESYYAQVLVGNPVQSFRVILDTASDDLWLMNSACGKECDGIAKYNATSSSTFVASQRPIGIEFGTGKAQGLIAEDTVSLAGYQVSRQSFAAMDQVDRSLAVIAPGSGIMGLPLTDRTAEAGTPFWLALARSRQMASPLFTLRLRRQKWDASVPKNVATKAVLSPGGTLTFGGVDTAQFSGPVSYSNVIANRGWTIPLKSVKINGRPIVLPNTAIDATIDSGTSLIIGPRSVISALYSQIPGWERNVENSDPNTDVYSIPCESSARIGLDFGGQDWTINPLDMATQSVGKGKDGKQHCIGAIFGLSEDAGIGSWIIGTPFLKNVFAVFDKGSARIGFAALKE